MFEKVICLGDRVRWESLIEYVRKCKRKFQYYVFVRFLWFL